MRLLWFYQQSVNSNATMVKLRQCVQFIFLIAFNVEIETTPCGSSLFPALESLQPASDVDASMVPNLQQEPAPQQMGYLPSFLSLPPDVAFSDLLSSIREPTYPQNIVAAKERLIFLISQNYLEVRPVLQYLGYIQNSNTQDLIITALAAVRETLPTNCYYRDELNTMISFCEQIKSSNIHQSECGCSECQKLIINLLRQLLLQNSQRNCPACSMAGFERDDFGINKQIKKSIADVREYTNAQLNMLLQVVPRPKTTIESTMYEKLHTLFQTESVAQCFSDIKVSSFHDQRELFQEVLKRLVESTSVSVEYKEVCSYYLHYEQHHYNYKQLVKLLPEPLDDDDLIKFNLVKELFESDEIYSYLESFDASQFTDVKTLFHAVLSALVQSSIRVEVKNAVKYYLDYEDSLAAVDLYAKKEIKKHFQLTQILKDCLDIKALSPDAKRNFKIFFNFILHTERAKLEEFDGWSAAKTRSDFTKAFFKYLLSQSYVSLDVKNAIIALTPLIKNVGNSALPP